MSYTCPFCNLRDAVVELSYNGYCVICNNCGARGPIEESARDAKHKWFEVKEKSQWQKFDMPWRYPMIVAYVEDFTTGIVSPKIITDWEERDGYWKDNRYWCKDLDGNEYHEDQILYWNAIPDASNLIFWQPMDTFDAKAIPCYVRFKESGVVGVCTKIGKETPDVLFVQKSVLTNEYKRKLPDNKSLPDWFRIEEFEAWKRI